MSPAFAPKMPQNSSELRTAPCPECFLCAREGKLLYEGLRDHVAGVPGTWRMRQCANAGCGLLWLDPKPVETDLLKAYASYHTHAAGSPGWSLWPRLLNAACRLASRTADQFTGLAAQRRQLKMMFLGARRPGRLLEIGSGGGRFLNRMRQAGWEVEGFEFDPKAAERIAKRYGIQVSSGSLAERRYAADSFDAVAMSHVLEHMHDPQGLLRECRRVLKPEGLLVVTTPNARSLAHAMYGRHWRGLEPPRHLQVFSPAALERCARAAGFGAAQLQTLSAESAGIYRASEEIRAIENGVSLRPGEFSRVHRSWALQSAEFNRAKEDSFQGEDILLLAAKD